MNTYSETRCSRKCDNLFGQLQDIHHIHVEEVGHNIRLSCHIPQLAGCILNILSQLYYAASTRVDGLVGKCDLQM